MSVAVIACAAVLAGLLLWSTVRLLSALRDAGRDRLQQRTAQLLALFAPGVVAVGQEPRALLVWQPLARTARALFPEEFAALDRAAGVSFPFSPEDVQAAHARWTATWLSWESAHDAEFKLRAATLEEELGEKVDTPIGRARLDAVAREKLERYQQQYEDYTRVSKALRALAER
jgi:hypothetical protein